MYSSEKINYFKWIEVYKFPKEIYNVRKYSTLLFVFANAQFEPKKVITHLRIFLISKYAVVN